MARVVTGALTLSTLTVGSETQPSKTRSGSAVIEIQSPSSSDPSFIQYRNSSSGGVTATQEFDALNGSSVRVSYAQVQYQIQSSVAGLHIGAILFNAARAGTLQTVMQLSGGNFTAVTINAASAGYVTLSVGCIAGGSSGLVVSDGTQSFSVYTSAGFVTLGATSNSTTQIVANSRVGLTVAASGSVSRPVTTGGSSAPNLAISVASVAGSYGVTLSAATGYSAIIGIASNNNSIGTSSVDLYQDAASAGWLVNRAVAGMSIGTTGASSLNFYTNGATRASVSSNGGMVINAPVSGTVGLQVTPVSGSAGISILAGSGNAFALRVQGGTSVPAAYFVNNSGVGSPGIRVDSSATTGTQTATFTATNKPGSSTTAPSQWLPVSLDGSTYYIPCFL